MSLQRLRIGEDTDGLYRAIDAVGRAEYSYFGTWSPFLRRTPYGVRRKNGLHVPKYEYSARPTASIARYNPSVSSPIRNR